MHAGGTQGAKSIKAYSWHSQNQSSSIKVLLCDLLMKDSLRFGLVSSDRLGIFRVHELLVLYHESFRPRPFQILGSVGVHTYLGCVIKSHIVALQR